MDGHPNRTDDDQVRRKRSDAEQERLNRELSEMLQEVRVAMPGVQLLFGFLLAVPFNQRFGQTTSAERGIYLFTLLCSAAASALFIAPTAFHRLLFRQRDKPAIIAFGSRMVIAALVALALAMTGSVLLVTSFLFANSVAALATIGVFLGFAWLWFGLPLLRRARERRRIHPGS